MKKEAKFFLNNPSSLTSTFIFVHFTCNDGKIKYSTQQKALPDHWNKSTQRVIEPQGDKKALKAVKDINGELNRLESVINAYSESCRILHKPILKNDLKKELDSKTHRNIAPEVKMLTQQEVFKLVIDKMKAGEILSRDNKVYAHASLVAFRTTAKQLKIFNANLTCDEITMDTYNDWIKFLNKKDYSKNSIGKMSKIWRTLINISNKLRLHNNLIYLNKEFKCEWEDVDKIYLNDAEIEKLRALDLSYNHFLESIRDRFIIGLFTGLRISDLKTLSVTNIINDNVVHVNKKTDNKVVIPVHPYIQEIIEKYNGKMPKQYNERIANLNIKAIAKLAGINDTIISTRTKGGKVVKESNEKWELITNHTMRRSLVSNLLKHADYISVMPVVGMSLQTLLKYNKRTPTENAEMLRSNPFFKKHI